MLPEGAVARVDAFLREALIEAEAVLDRALARSAEAGLLPHAVPPPQGAFLQILVQALGAKRVLEIGTLGACSTIWLARGLPEDGRLVTLERFPT